MDQRMGLAIKQKEELFLEPCSLAILPDKELSIVIYGALLLFFDSKYACKLSFMGQIQEVRKAT